MVCYLKPHGLSSIAALRHGLLRNLPDALIPTGVVEVGAVVRQNFGKHADKAVRAPPAKFLNSPCVAPDCIFCNLRFSRFPAGCAG